MDEGFLARSKYESISLETEYPGYYMIVYNNLIAMDVPLLMIKDRYGKDQIAMMPYIDYSLCAGCGACAELYPLFFEMRDERPWVINAEKFVFDENRVIANCCPFRAVFVE